MSDTPETPEVLDVLHHDRDIAGLTYVYPVVSRRANGVSVGINLNPNNACNWRCIYCQVPGLQRGTGPVVDLALLERELRAFLRHLLQGDFMEKRVPEGLRRFNDIAFSGNGEATTVTGFEQAVELVGRLRGELGVPPETKLVLITNGSMARRPAVQRAFERMSQYNGEIWFKMDSGLPAGVQRINSAATTVQEVRDGLRSAAERCPTWIQTCVFNLDGKPLPEGERAAYLETLKWARDEKVPVRGVFLYGPVRQSHREEASRITLASPEWKQAFADDIVRLGFEVRVTE